MSHVSLQTAHPGPPSRAAEEAALDEALAETFPASDPIAITFYSIPAITESAMPKNHDSHKNDKKAPLKNAREKRAVRKAKKEESKRMSITRVIH